MIQQVQNGVLVQADPRAKQWEREWVKEQLKRPALKPDMIVVDTRSLLLDLSAPAEPSVDAIPAASPQLHEESSGQAGVGRRLSREVKKACELDEE